MVHAAVYIKKKLKEDMVLSQGFGKCAVRIYYTV
jgi:hypothetical protein